MTSQDLRDGLKMCTYCGQWRPPDAFPTNKHLSSGLSSWCTECHRDATRRWRAEHPDQVERANARRRREPLEPRSCATCGINYAPVRRDQRYCSRECKTGRSR